MELKGFSNFNIVLFIAIFFLKYFIKLRFFFNFTPIDIFTYQIWFMFFLLLFFRCFLQLFLFGNFIILFFSCQI